jgi:hypothetical protein
MILGDCENDVAVRIVFNLRERTFVTGEENGTHIGCLCGIKEKRGEVWRGARSKFEDDFSTPPMLVLEVGGMC